MSIKSEMSIKIGGNPPVTASLDTSGNNECHVHVQLFSTSPFYLTRVLFLLPLVPFGFPPLPLYRFSGIAGGVYSRLLGYAPFSVKAGQFLLQEDLHCSDSTEPLPALTLSLVPRLRSGHYRPQVPPIRPSITSHRSLRERLAFLGDCY